MSNSYGVVYKTVISLSTIRRYLIAGLLVWLPLSVTLLVIKLLVDLMDNTLLLLPEAYRPDTLLGFHLPGLGVVLSITILFVTGIVAANFFGRRLVEVWERLLARIPLVRSIYSGTKQVSETLFAPGGQSFRKVLLIEYPRRGLWTVAFQTGVTAGEAQAKTRLHLIAAQIYITIAQPCFFIDVLFVELEGERLRAVQYFQLLAQHLDLTGDEMRIFRALGAVAHPAGDAQHVLVSDSLGDGKRVAVGGVKHQLHQALAVAQVYENYAAVVAPAVRPAAQGDLLAFQRGVEMATVMATHCYLFLKDKKRG